VTDEQDDFATLFAASQQATRITKGQQIEGTIVAIGPEVAFVSVGAKGEATISVDELKDENGWLEAAVGDRIQATVASTAGGLTLSRKLQRRAASARQVEDAFRAGLPVEGKVEGQVKGGYNVGIARMRAFCPLSQIDIARTNDPAVHEGRVYTFKIIEYAEGGRKFVVSRRALLEEEQKVRAAELKQSLVPGSIVTGRVASVRDFGAFVDLGAGVQGLLHVSEMTWTRADASQVVAPDQTLTVKIVRVEGDKIALSLKQLTDDPWSVVQATYSAGQVREGRIARVADFGVFVELAPGIVGLVPASESGVPKGADLKKAFPIGTTVEVIVLEIDAAGRRLRLSFNAVKDAAEAAEVREYEEREEASPAPSFGSLADKLKNALKK
jgi:small subunit ribosomal protein S1